MEATLEEGGIGPQGHIPRKNKNKPKEKPVWVEVPSSLHGEPRY